MQTIHIQLKETQQSTVELRYLQRLTKFFQDGLNRKAQRFVFVLDDFEANLEFLPNVEILNAAPSHQNATPQNKDATPSHQNATPQNRNATPSRQNATPQNRNAAPLQAGALLKPGVVEVLMALLKAIQNSRLPHRVIITSRYEFRLPELNNRLYSEPLAALQDADLVKKYNRLEAFNGNLAIDEQLQASAKKAADGNPRLLEWLNQILQDSQNPTPNPQARRGVGVEEILQKMGEAEDKFREHILAEELLKLQSAGLRKMLGKLLVYELPVPLAAISPVCADVPHWESHLERAASLGLLEVTLINSNGGERLYRVPRILEPLLEFPENDKGEELYQQATQVLYRLWWEEGKTATEAQKLEMHRLALLGKNGEIAAQMAQNLADNWKNQSRFREAVHLCKSTLEITQDYRVLHQIAYSESELGEVEQAQQNYQQALELCPETEEREKAAIIHNLAITYANRGDVENAIALYNQSLEITERIGNVQGKAMTLWWLGDLAEQQGEYTKAISYLQPALEILQRLQSPDAEKVRVLLAKVQQKTAEQP